MKNAKLYHLYKLWRSLISAHNSKLDFNKTYLKHVRLLLKKYPRDQAMQLAVGGRFEPIGRLECNLLIQFGLKKDEYVIDVGCGSGRLADPLSQYLSGKYLGIDIVPELIDYARNLVNRPDWRFEIVEGLSIPENDGKADMVCFFSVFTHLLHEQSYMYLLEAKRVLKPGGKIIFSFLEFSISSHWPVFEENMKTVTKDNPLNMFISRDAIDTWASHLNLKIEAFQDDNTPEIPLSNDISLGKEISLTERGSLGQSVCVLSLLKQT